MVIFIALPFVGAYIGYQLAGERVVEVSIPVVSPLSANPIATSSNISSEITQHGCGVTTDLFGNFPDLTNVKIGQTFGAFTYATNSFAYTCKTSNGREYGNTILTLGYTGTTTLHGHIEVSMDDQGGHVGGDAYIVAFVVDSSDLVKLPDQSATSSSNRLTIDGLQKHPFVIETIAKCKPGEYCTALQTMGTSAEMAITVSNFYKYFSEYGGDTYGKPNDTNLVSN